jgi:hypothetical protein
MDKKHGTLWMDANVMDNWLGDAWQTTIVRKDGQLICAQPMDLETVVGKEDLVGVDYDVKRLRLPVLPTCLSPALLRKQTPDLRILFFDLPELFPR